MKLYKVQAPVVIDGLWANSVCADIGELYEQVQAKGAEKKPFIIETACFMERDEFEETTATLCKWNAIFNGQGTFCPEGKQMRFAMLLVDEKSGVCCAVDPEGGATAAAVAVPMFKGAHMSILRNAEHNCTGKCSSTHTAMVLLGCGKVETEIHTTNLYDVLVCNPDAMATAAEQEAVLPLEDVLRNRSVRFGGNFAWSRDVGAARPIHESI